MAATKPAFEADANRRIDTRYQAPPYTYAALGDKFSRVGRIINISLGGLVFEYISVLDFQEKPNWVDIFTTDGRFHLNRIPCKAVDDWIIQSAGNVFTRGCRLEFGSLSPSQEKTLEAFISTERTV